MKIENSVIQRQADLERLIPELKRIIGLDTEFHRRTTFYPTPCVLQIATSTGAYVVDLLAPLNLEQLEARLFCPDLIKVTHSPREDLELFYLIFGRQLPNLVDVQLAHAFVSTDRSLSYSALVDHYIDFPFAKNDKLTQSDWRTRPLAPRQIAYALDDVRYLIPIWDQIRTELTRLGRLSWFMEEMQHFFHSVYQFRLSNVAAIPEHARWKSIDLQVYFGLLEWRERIARSRNRPRERVLTSKSLRNLTENHEQERAFFVKNYRKSGSRWYRLISQAKRRATQSNPLYFHSGTKLSRRRAHVIQRLKQPIRELVAQKSMALEMATETLGRSQHIGTWVSHYAKHQDLPPMFGAWREEVMGAEIRAILNA